MITCDLFRGTTVTEVIQGKRFASYIFRACKRIRVPVIGKVRGAKDHDAVEIRGHFRFAPIHLAVPQLQVPTILFAPILIQIQQQIDPPIKSKLPMFVEIRVYSQFAPTDYLMKAAPFKARVGNQIIDAGDGTQKLEKSYGIQVVHEQARGWPERSLCGRCKLDLLRGVELLPANGSWFREFPEPLIDDARRKKIIEHNVGIRLRIYVARMRCCGN